MAVLWIRNSFKTSLASIVFCSHDAPFSADMLLSTANEFISLAVPASQKRVHLEDK
jgi:hypothetical protein